VFDHEFNSIEGSNQDDLSAYNYVMDSIFNLKHSLFLILTSRFTFIPFQQRFSKNVDTLMVLVRKLVKNSLKKLDSGEKATSLLDFMIQGWKEGEMTEEQLESNVFIFFLAGHETTAKSLTWILHLLAKNPEIQEKARKEVKEILGDKECTYEDISTFDYLSKIIKEGLRLYSPASEVTRITTKDTELEGYKIPKGTRISVSIFGIHHVSVFF
jgi:cytochrome P450